MKNYFKITYSLILFIFSATISFAQLTIIIDKLPDHTPEDAKIFISGDFIGWQPAVFALKKNDDGKFQITLTDIKKEIQFKFTRGSWETGECKASGDFQPNRSWKPTDQKTIHVTIEGWDDFIKKEEKSSTALPNVQVLTDSFYIPQLNRYRRVWVYLPASYKKSKKRYPVLYMHDGQNVFDKTTAYSGEWHVDETLSQLEKSGKLELIVVAVNNGQKYRMSEYNPWVHQAYGGGEGDEYIEFIVKTLKPHIDKQFRTKRNRKNTGIMGSSMGGLISMYAILEYPNIFGKAGVFSPAFWAGNEKPFVQAQEKAKKKMKIYMLMGKQEGDMMVNGQEKMAKILKMKKLKDKSMQNIIIDGRHNETFWAKEFEKAILWLF